MKTIINLLLILGILFLAYLLAQSIREPIAFKNEKDKREDAVVAQLKKVRQAQEIYRSIHGTFASSFDSLEYHLRNGQIPFERVTGDPDDPTGASFTIDTIYYSAQDTMDAMNISIDSLRYVPYGEGAIFDIAADTLTYQKTLVSVTEVGVERKKFMGPYGSEKFAKYDDSYDPSSKLKFGSMDSPNLGGNWER